MIWLDFGELHEHPATCAVLYKSTAGSYHAMPRPRLWTGPVISSIQTAGLVRPIVASSGGKSPARNRAGGDFRDDNHPQNLRYHQWSVGLPDALTVTTAS